MSKTDFFHTIEFGGQQVEVNVLAHVTIGSGHGSGGPDPAMVEELMVKRLDDGKDITSDLDEATIERLEAMAYDRAYERAMESDFD